MFYITTVLELLSFLSVALTGLRWPRVLPHDLRPRNLGKHSFILRLIRVKFCMIVKDYFVSTYSFILCFLSFITYTSCFISTEKIRAEHLHGNRIPTLLSCILVTMQIN